MYTKVKEAQFLFLTKYFTIQRISHIRINLLSIDLFYDSVQSFLPAVECMNKWNAMTKYEGENISLPYKSSFGGADTRHVQCQHKTHNVSAVEQSGDCFNLFAVHKHPIHIDIKPVSVVSNAEKQLT